VEEVRKVKMERRAIRWRMGIGVRSVGELEVEQEPCAL
jgi:hypothetical protein